jgi:hypothetical protein
MIESRATAPPHPFRESPWYDPEVVHRPCECPACQQERASAARPVLMPLRIVLVVLGGVALPLVSLLVNLELHVLALGALGHAAVLLSVLATLANLVLNPRRRARRAGKHRRPVVSAPPRSTALRIALLVGALASCVTWGYLALLFLPLAPISVVAILFVGLGLCGLCPFGALSIAMIQAYHATRAVAERIGRRRARALVLAGLLLPPVAAVALGTRALLERRQVLRAVDRVARTAPHSAERMLAIAELRGLEQRLADCYVASADRSQHEILAEAYLRLTDTPINAAVSRRHNWRRGNRGALIRPWWFLEGARPVTFDLWRLP